MNDLIGSRTVRALLATHHVRPRKELGQNFVIDPNTIRKVVEVSGVKPTDVVLEVGAGVGSLTLGLAATARRVVAVEKDGRLLGALGESLKGCGNVDVIEGDILEIDLTGLRANKVVANLPYNIAATATLRILEQAPEIDDLTVMVQREVGERLAASVGTKAYGAVSVLVSYWATTRVVSRVGRGSFYPRPEVESALVKLTRAEPPDVPYEGFRRVTRAAFEQRRKTLRNSLAFVAGGTDKAEEALLSAGIDPGDRAERVDARAFARLSTFIER
jgi:16S rRNA (adenine1518-N6/adenine1519-N6)-dimethyltransferase